ncbi:hypothetical protein [Fischerella thermalis]|nr:hypothetical protein [Fischerella thermalis]
MKGNKLDTTEKAIATGISLLTPFFIKIYLANSTKFPSSSAQANA